MPITSEHVEIERKPKLGGGGPGKTPHRRGYGGGDDGDPDRFRNFHSRRERLRRYRVGMALCIISVSALFVSLTLLYVYVFRQQMGPWDPGTKSIVHDWKPIDLPYLLLWINSAVLLLSSITLELARRRMLRQAEFAELGIQPIQSRRGLPWLGLTVLLGFGFLVGQWVICEHFLQQGAFQHTNPSRSFFFILTGMHAVHLLGGLLALLYAAAGELMQTGFESQMLTVEVTGWYWHFMGGLWMYIFGLLYFVR